MTWTLPVLIGLLAVSATFSFGCAVLFIASALLGFLDRLVNRGWQ